MLLHHDLDAILTARFGHDSLIALATLDDGRPSVRTVNAIYVNGAFYSITYALSNKMKQIEIVPTVGLCGEWFSGHGTAESLGHLQLQENAALAEHLRTAFAAWYGNGHINEADPNTIILRIQLTDGVLFHHGQRYEFDESSI